MTPAEIRRLRKAAGHEVFPKHDGTFAVAGRTGNYSVAPDYTGDLFCSCPARARCTHILAVREAAKRKQLHITK